jgi:hypothetical protein
MTLTVEDGSGLPTADSYVSLEASRIYWLARGFDYSGFAGDEIEAALRRASSYLDGRYGGRFPGFPVQGRAQSLCWPRTKANDRSGQAIASNAVPSEVAKAIQEAAWRELVVPGSLSPDTVSQRVLSESVAGISVSYANAGDQRPLLTIIEEVLGPILEPGNVTFLQRA